jgi:hypothetical protein|tara:strand:- start:60 stop:377 length:318 start_codon:yes stop_codon:yes gene_type:complete
MKTKFLITYLFLSSLQVFASSIEDSRNKFINDWNKYIGKKIEFTENTLVVYVKNKSNPFKKKDDYANEYHPKYLNGQKCKELDIKFIQVRSLVNNKILSGISCSD